MDARNLLRRYIEQRREAGETELVLDSLHVEEVMRLLGAAGAGRAANPSARPAMADPDQTGDWRTTLREAGLDAEKGETRVSESAVSPPPTATGPVLASPAAERLPSETPRVGRLDFVPAELVAEKSAEVAFKKGLVVGLHESELIPGPIAQLGSLDEIADTVQKCTRCPLHATATNGVPGEGDPNADLVCVGEAPGASEDATGRPFVGQAGQLLTKILASIDLEREQVFIVNVLKHRPPGNRNPLPEEVEACSPYLIRQLELIKPKVILAFGTFAAQTLLQTKTPLGQLRGLVHRYHGTPLVVTYHPAALLRNPSWKRPTWEDVKLARRVLDSATRS
ncbi:MAG TPA: uracil-DNA glycosylase [Gemmatimonadaceae bacterium]|nr:uracil-DNA glycosylase [Gemmatimonadaceae bacterium]